MATKSDADVNLLTLADAVAPVDKTRAGKNIIADPSVIGGGRRTISARNNRLDSNGMSRDAADAVQRAAARPALMVSPKPGTAADVRSARGLVTRIGVAKGYGMRIGFVQSNAPALGRQNLSAIAAAAKRDESLHCAVADHAAPSRACTASIGSLNPHCSTPTGPLDDISSAPHRGDMWHDVSARLIVAARAKGLHGAGGPFGDLSDREGRRAAARRTVAPGRERKCAIHRDRIALADVLTGPTEAGVDRADRIREALERAPAEGKGSLWLGRRRIGHGAIRRAEASAEQARPIAGS